MAMCVLVIFTGLNALELPSIKHGTFLSLNIGTRVPGRSRPALRIWVPFRILTYLKRGVHDH